MKVEVLFLSNSYGTNPGLSTSFILGHQRRRGAGMKARGSQAEDHTTQKCSWQKEVVQHICIYAASVQAGMCLNSSKPQTWS